MNRPETVDETAALVDEAGGHGIPVRVDHPIPEEVRVLVARIRREQGCLHVLVNDIWGAKIEWNKSVWESSLESGPHTLRLAVDTHPITSHYALPLLIQTPGGLVAEVTDGTDEYNAANYRASFFYDLAEASVNRMAFRAGARAGAPWCDRRDPHARPAASEAMLEAHGVAEANWRDAIAHSPHFAFSESPASSGGRWPRSRRTPGCRAGTASRCPADGWRRSTASPASTAVGPMPGDMSPRSRPRAGRPADVMGYR
ncbi:short-chain dehydrogenase [Streptomyces atratus]|nr:short-chain dehydrogenase [Streptomyces atratus]